MPQDKQHNSAHAWRFFNRPSDTWDAMYHDCENAKTSIEFEQYILEDDPVGQKFMELFIKQAKAGVSVFLICDTFGSALLTHSPLVQGLRKHGGHVHFYNQLSGWKLFAPWRWFPRIHTKTLLIDSAIAYTGGVCLAERMRDWRDTHMRISGQVTLQIRHAFDDIEHRLLHKKRTPLPDAPSNSTFRYFLNQPFKKRRAIYHEFKKAVMDAKEYIYITSAFFIPNRRFLRLLKQASARGVDVRVLVPEFSDVLPADWLRLSYTPRFLQAGLRIFHYQKTVLHSKTAIIDDSWGTVGSTNFDVISFFHNREANIMTSEKTAIAELKKQFFIDLENSVEITAENWIHIPPWKKFGGFCFRLLRIFF